MTRLACRAPAPRIGRSMKPMLYLVVAGVSLSGVAWLGLHYFGPRPGPFGLMRNPWEGQVLALHGAFAIASAWLFGWLWNAHLGAAWRTRRQRGTGVTLAAVFALLIVTGYLLYYLAGDYARAVTGVVHWSLGLAAVAVFLAHRFRVGRG